jgi:Superinfection immunity protein
VLLTTSIPDLVAFAAFVLSLGLGLALIVGLYLLPTIVAARRHVSNVGSIAVINVLLGWLFVGWVVALALAARSVPPASAS